MLVLLDNVASVAQARPLMSLSGTASSVVVVTSRRRLGGLLAEGAKLLPLGPLEEDAAVDLLARLTGTTRVADEWEAARLLVSLCGRLPIAVCVVAARLASRPQSRIAGMVEEMRGERQRLRALSVDDLSVTLASRVLGVEIDTATPASGR